MRPKFRERMEKTYDTGTGRRMTVSANRDAVVVYQARKLADESVKTESTIFSSTEALMLWEALGEWRAFIPQKKMV